MAGAGSRLPHRSRLRIPPGPRRAGDLQLHSADDPSRHRGAHAGGRIAGPDSRHDSVRRLLHGAKKLRAGDRRPATGLTRQHMRKIAPIATPKQWALLCLMRDCLLRRSEAAAARWRDLECEPDGTTGHFTVPYSKTDQNGHGSVLFVTKKTMASLRAIRPRQPAPGARIFDWSPHWISRIIAGLAGQAGLHGDFSGHSPRIGMAQDLERLGASLPQIQAAGRWKGPQMPAYYIRSISSGHSAVAKLEEFLV